ncbi:MAG: YraN family protein [bacterium]|nr:YraN family protein [bacterium]
MKQFNREIGKRGEKIAAKFLKDKGYKILERNYSTKFGEIDLIVVKNNVLRFVEVKLKKGDFFGTPEEMIGTDKLGRVQRMAEYYLMDKPEIARKYEKYSVDAVCIVSDGESVVERISLYENIGF